MSFTSGFFNSIGGDRTYNARDISMYFKGLISDGVYSNVGNMLQVVTANSGMNVNIMDGRAIIDCQYANNDSVYTLTLDAPEVNKRRYDVVALRLDMTSEGRSVTPVIKKGTSVNYSVTPTVPARTWTENIKEIYLAKIQVYPNISTILQSYITDLRGTSNCGYVTGLIDQVDTSQLFAQYQAACDDYFLQMTTAFNTYIAEKQQAFNTWFDNLTSTLTVDTSIAKYQHSEILTDDTGYINNMNMNIDEYTLGDIVFIYIGGVLLVEGSDYTIEGAGASALITFPRQLKDTGRGVPITIICIKSVIGGEVINTVGDAYGLAFGAELNSIIGTPTEGE